MTAALGRGLGMLIVIIQTYFNWSPNSTVNTPLTNSEEIHPLGHLSGLILAREGSKGILHKNFAELNGKPLIYWALQAMIESGVFTTIWVSTNDKRIANWLSTTYTTIVGVHIRAEYTATDEASSLIAVLEFLKYHPEIDYIGLVQATSPFIQPTYLSEAAVLLRKFDSVFSTTRSHQLRWKSTANPNLDSTTPLNFNPRNRPRRQDWNGEMVENGMFYFASRDIIMNYSLFQGSKSTYVEIPKIHSLEIDTQNDLELARFMMRNKTQLPPTKLKMVEL